jgi:hypothetical protein
MIWVGWRLQRTETLIVAAILAVIAAVLLPTGLRMISAYNHEGLSACLGANPSDSCSQALSNFTEHFGKVGHLIDWFTLLPGLIGGLLATPLTSALESGTHRLDWTQSITRGRWLAGKLALAVGTAVVASAAFIALITWWRGPFVHIHGRLENSVYDSEGIVVFGYTLFAFGLAAAVGVVWRRAVPALFIAYVGYFVTRLFVDTWLRERLVSPITSVIAFNRPGNPDLSHAWVLSELPSDRHGNPVDVMPPLCDPATGVCKGVARDVYTLATYHPASHFWPLQLIETALFGGAALALVGFAAWWMLRRAV